MVNKTGLTSVLNIHDEIILSNYPCKIFLYFANIYYTQKIIPAELVFIFENQLVKLHEC